MTRVPYVASVLVAVAITSCCQTLWLKVTRREGPPPYPITLPRALPGAIPIPRLENRFLPSLEKRLLPAGSALAEAQGYTDQLDPRNDPSDEITAALAGLDAIWTAGGDPGPKLDVLRAAASSGAPRSVPAIVRCEKKGKAVICKALEISNLTSALPAAPQAVRIDYKENGTAHVLWAGVASCEGIQGKPAGGSAAAVPGTGSDQEPQGPCGSTASGTRVVLTRSIPVNEGDTVEVSLESAFELSRPVLTFVHMSDTQLRDPNVKLTSPVLSARLDHLVESFEHDEDQELYGPELAEALVATINEEVKAHASSPAEAPSFVIHTGDSVDSGTKRELVLFHEIMDRLTIPWFNMIGNHDVLVFGNFLPAANTQDRRCVSQESIVAPYFKAPRWLLPGRLCVPLAIEGHHVGALDAFIAGQSHAEALATFTAEHARHTRAKVVRNKVMEPCDGVLMPGPHDRQHGFDLYPRRSLNAPLPGYYAFAVHLDLGVDAGTPDKRRAIFIALNSEDLEPNEGGNAGRVGEPQLKWLDKALKCAQPRDLVFLFAHHQLGAVKLHDGSRLRDNKLMKSPNIVGYFYGHNHQHGLCREPKACQQFWELESGSLIEHPQEARLVRIKTIGAGLAFIETVVFTDRLEDPTGPFAQRVMLARRGADHDRCLSFRCSGDNHVRREDGRFTSARLFFKLP
ncbi:MAG TPA: metallophosphoesterase [Kofleriaceae bacterium]|nr:metallophosphoesterase [Kofleriaceae bacterium]